MSQSGVLFTILTELREEERGAICQRLVEKPPPTMRAQSAFLIEAPRGQKGLDYSPIPIMKHHPSMTQEEEEMGERTRHLQGVQYYVASFLDFHCTERH